MRFSRYPYRKLGLKKTCFALKFNFRISLVRFNTKSDGNIEELN